MKKVLLTILVILWMLLIFSFSSQTGKQSTKTSDAFVNRIVNITEKFPQKSYNKKNVKNTRRVIEIIIRKSAHFLEYFILAILVYLMFKEYNIPKIYLFTVLFCLMYAISDEIHQLFIDKRSGQVIDVCIDTLGAILSTIIMYFKGKKSKIK